jgi:hypothetical protein
VHPEEVEVEGRRSAEPGQVRRSDEVLRATPARQTQDLLRSLPGLTLSAHGGRGKGAQFFLRGFDAVHGADLSGRLEGVPLNLPNHAHAHGYLDLDLVPSELVRAVTLKPGAPDGRAGDMAVAGTVHLEIGAATPGWTLGAGAGTDRSGVLSIGWSPGQPETFVFGELDGGLGVGQGRSWRQARLAAGVGSIYPWGRVRVWALTYQGVFQSPGVLREDDWRDRTVRFWGAYPGAGGGRTARGLAAVQVDSAHARATGWVGGSRMGLTQNFTGWYHDPTHGDQIDQEDTRGDAGVLAEVWGGNRALRPMAGVEARIDNGATSTGAANLLRTAFLQSELAAWTGIGWRLMDWAVEPSVRAAWLGGTLGSGAARASGAAPVVAPRLRVAWGRARGFGTWAVAGRGYRSAPAGIYAGGRAPVATADQAEVGARWDGVRGAARVVGFGAAVSDEVVFDHVTGRFLTTGATRRVGGEAGLTWLPRPWLRLEAQGTGVAAFYLASSEPIPYVPRAVGLVSAQVEGASFAGATWNGGARVLLLGPRPLTSGFLGPGSALVDLTARVSPQRGQWSIDLEAENVLGTRAWDGAFVYPSDWDPAPGRSELPVRHFTAARPPSARVTLTRRVP